MTNKQIDVLESLGKGLKFHSVDEPTQEIILWLNENGLCQSRVDIGGDGYFRITQQGLHELQQLRQSHKEYTETKRQNRILKNIAITNLIISLVSFFSGIVIQYKVGIVEVITSLFQ